MVKKVFIAIFFLFLLGMGYWSIKFWIPSQLSGEVKKNSKELSQKNENLSDEVLKLKEAMSLVQEKCNFSSPKVNCDLNTEKWDCWCELRFCLNQGNEYKESWEKFQKLFSDDVELVKMVDELIKKAIQTPILSSIFTKYLRNFVKIYRVNELDMLKIEGRILIKSLNWRN